MEEKLFLQSRWVITKDGKEEVQVEGNLFLKGGLSSLRTLIVGGSVKAYGSDARLGVGKGMGPALFEQTDLLDSPSWLTLDPGFPKVIGDEIIYQATAGEGTANHQWQEFALRSGDNTLLNRKVEYLGEKAKGVWTLLFALSLSVKEV